MTEQDLAAIRERVDNASEFARQLNMSTVDREIVRRVDNDTRALLAEVERLRAVVEAYRDDLHVALEHSRRASQENAALRDFLRRFVAYDDNPWVNRRVTPNEARALLGETQEKASETDE